MLRMFKKLWEKLVKGTEVGTPGYKTMFDALLGMNAQLSEIEERIQYYDYVAHNYEDADVSQFVDDFMICMDVRHDCLSEVILDDIYKHSQERKIANATMFRASKLADRLHSLANVVKNKNKEAMLIFNKYQ